LTEFLSAFLLCVTIIKDAAACCVTSVSFVIMRICCRCLHRHELLRQAREKHGNSWHWTDGKASSSSWAPFTSSHYWSGLWSRKSRHPTPTPGNFDYPTPTFSFISYL